MKYIKNLFILFVLSSLGMLQAESNFSLKNATKHGIYFSLGSKKQDPMNKKFNVLVQGKTFETNITLKDYPELIVSSFQPFSGDRVLYFEVDKDLTGKKIYIQVEDRPWNEILKGTQGIGLKLIGDLKIIPQKGSGWFWSGIKNNITEKDYTTYSVIYKATKSENDPYKVLSHIVGSTIELTKKSPAYEKFGLYQSDLKKKNKKEIIQKRYDELIKSIDYLKNQPDMQQLYKQLYDIITNSYKELMVTGASAGA